MTHANAPTRPARRGAGGHVPGRRSIRPPRLRLPPKSLRFGRGCSAAIVLLLLVAMAGLFVATTRASESPVIGPVRAYELAMRGELTIIDIRRPSEWQETGVPQGATRISLQSDRGLPGFLEEIDSLAGGDRSRPIALICAGGVRSRLAARVLRAQGYTNVLDIREGMLGSSHGPGWLERRLPKEN